jgi:hypothetical protein
MARVILPKGTQSSWLKELTEKTKLNSEEMARICGVSSRTFRDWKREKFTISESALLKLSNHFALSLPENIKIVSNFWYVTKGARKGALKRMEIYGPPGTPEGRKKGGKISQLRRKENPGKYKALGCIIRKDFSGIQKSKDLAEALGIILGDGGITPYQVIVTLDRKTDREYAAFVQNLFERIFGERPSFRERYDDNSINLTLSGIGLVERLSNLGVGKGNKILRQVDFPKWIWGNMDYQIACVRGLFDTDGCIYFHYHWTKGIRYRNLGFCFTSFSVPLLTSFYKVLQKAKIKSYPKSGRIYIYDFLEIEKYFKIFGSSNPKHTEKFVYHQENSRVLEKKQGEVA